MDAILKFATIADALHGTGGYADGTALVRFPSETQEQYDRRREVAWYANDLLPACQRFTGFLSSRPPLRETMNPLLLAFLDDCNWRGDQIDVFWQSFMIDALARGSMLLLVDMPRSLPSSQAAQIAQRAFPFLTPIMPEWTYASRLDARGHLTFFEMHDMLDGERVIRGWDAQRWWVRVGERILDEAEHPLGVCPVIAFTERGDFPTLGAFSGITDLSRRLYNLRSELDDILRRHAFPVFAAQFQTIEPAPGESVEAAQNRQNAIVKGLVDAIGKLGTDRGIVSPGPVSFVAPPDGPANVYMQAIALLEERIAEIALRVDMTGEKSAESGLALTIRFQALNTALVRFAKRMEDLERRALDLACRWLGLAPETVTAHWNRDYKIVDTGAELELLGVMQLQGFPPEVIRAKMKTVVQMEFGGGDSALVDDLVAVIDEVATEVAPDVGAGGTAPA